MQAARTLLALGAVCAAACAQAQTVALSGSLGDRALLVIDGTPRTVVVGGTANGVRLLSVHGTDAVVEIKGARVTISMGGAPVSLGGAASAGGGHRIVLTAGSGGHFVAGGSINGHATRFLVDTGATNVALSQAEAKELGVDFRSGQRGWSQTANGAVAVHHVTLTSVRVGDVTVYQVDATVVPMPLQYVLLGNSFLTRFQMTRENDVMTLEKRP